MRILKYLGSDFCHSSNSSSIGMMKALGPMPLASLSKIPSAMEDIVLPLCGKKNFCSSFSPKI